ncbi:MAG: hypothetical protein NUV88_01205 [Candidatus Kaiserbacteria bacterium]|nr:hypothetical protein [Candidatus Kaiserbacteria bacterium]
MKHNKQFSGIAVYSDPNSISKSKVTIVGTKKGAALVGVSLPEGVSSQRCREIRRLNKHLDPRIGMIGVRPGATGGTSVTFIGPMQSLKEARKNAISMAKIVEEATGVRSILRKLSNHRAVSRALAS